MLGIIRKGNLGKDAVLAHTANGKAVLKFSVAEQIGYGEHKSTSWWNCSLWGVRAEKLGSLLRKGTTVCVTGEASIRKYQAKDGQQKESLEINVDSLELFSRAGFPSASEEQAQERVNHIPPSSEPAFNFDDIPF